MSVVMLFIAIGITVAVYGFVALIVKADDLGLYMAKKGRRTAVRNIGRGIILCMPPFLTVLGYVGTAAMLWVGAEIIAHGIPPLHHALEEVEHALTTKPVLAWCALYEGKIKPGWCCAHRETTARWARSNPGGELVRVRIVPVAPKKCAKAKRKGGGK